MEIMSGQSVKRSTMIRPGHHISQQESPGRGEMDLSLACNGLSKIGWKVILTLLA